MRDNDNNLAKVQTRMVIKAKQLVVKECARRRKLTGQRTSEGVVLAEAVFAYLGKAKPQPEDDDDKDRVAA